MKESVPFLISWLASFLLGITITVLKSNAMHNNTHPEYHGVCDAVGVLTVYFFNDCLKQG